MKTTIELTKFLSSLPVEGGWADKVAEMAADAPEKIVKRTSASVELSFKEDDAFTSSGIITTPQVDRDMEIVVSAGMDVDSYKENPVLLYGHRWGEPPIGSQKDIEVSGGGITATQKYASTPFAQDIATLVREKHLKTFSIGFVPLQRFYKGQDGFVDAMESFTQQFGHLVPNASKAKILTTKSVLLENSVVNIPANPGAQVQAVSKALGLSEETLKELGLEVELEELEEEEVKMILKPVIKLIKRAEPVDVGAIVHEQIRLLKGGI